MPFHQSNQGDQSLSLPLLSEHTLLAIRTELEYQRQKWGVDKAQSLPGYLMVLKAEIEEAELAWLKNRTEPRQPPLEEVVQVAAVAIACLEQYGVIGSAIATNDLSE